MHIIITLAGHSRRFKEAGYNEPKFLIEIDGIKMIEHVVNMFDSTDKYYFVINSQQFTNYPNIISELKQITKNAEIVITEPHEYGPTYSALQVKSIPNDEPIIISYCDFYVSWDYDLFKREIYGYDGAIPSFRGFHPASFGNTYYAYLRVNENNELLELKEKASFTKVRHEEFASTGIYYFREWSLFCKYSDILFNEGFGELNEAYVSLLFNFMINNGHKIKVTEVDKFVCWGTPEDLKQYLNWSGYFNRLKREVNQELTGHKQTNLVPMAGMGQRFRKFGYRTSKPLIQIGKKSMVELACNSFPIADKWIFLPRKDDCDNHPISRTLRSLASNCSIVQVDHETSGQAATCLLAKDKLVPEKSLFIASCDYETLYSNADWSKIVEDKTIDGVIWTYRLENCLAKDPKAFAYCLTGDDNVTIIKIVEKDTISNNPEKDPMVVGSFWFRYAKDFIYAAETAIRLDINVNGEHYVANSINLLLEQGKRFVIFDIEQWISFGDPFELQVYEYWDDFFEKSNYNNKF
jgi:NDP-sugar pyrophosphorylase family protein